MVNFILFTNTMAYYVLFTCAMVDCKSLVKNSVTIGQKRCYSVTPINYTILKRLIKSEFVLTKSQCSYQLDLLKSNNDKHVQSSHPK